MMMKKAHIENGFNQEQKKNDYYLIKYREAIRAGKIIAGRELIMELDRPIEDLEDERYIYDTEDAYLRMDFMENCIRLTKRSVLQSAYEVDVVAKGFH